MSLRTLVAEFADQISTIVHSRATERARAAVLAALGVAPRRGPGRPPKTAAKVAIVAPAAKKARKKAPLQLCPVPGCKNPAAPIFGMVCAKHKDLPKAKIKAFREARSAKKLGLPVPKAGKRKAAKRAVARKAASKKPARRKAPKKIVKAEATVQATTAATPAAA